MAEICCGVVLSEGDNTHNPVLSSVCESTSSRAARRRRIKIRRFKFVDGISSNNNPITDDDSDIIDGTKRQRMDFASSSFPRECTSNAVETSVVSNDHVRDMISSSTDNNKSSEEEDETSTTSFYESSIFNIQNFVPKFGVASVCGRRRDMEDAVAVHPSFFRLENCSDSDISSSELHYFGVYDGHGCSHVAMRCRERLHELVKEELVAVPEWKLAMERSFSRMDKEAIAWNDGVIGNCRCELQTPECDAVGSTAVVAIVTPEKIIVANCGDSRAVLCRNGKSFPLSDDHKPDRPDELNRIEEAGGRVIFWDGARVLGVLAMSRAIGDNYLKPYVSCEPEVTIMDRTVDDDCLILASDGLWDVVSNDTACGVARMCLRGKVPPATLTPEVEQITGVGEAMADKACTDASMLLTKLALARHSTDNVSVVVIDLRKDA
ncbi:probable protein phosphatase 2C 24 isoform X2 [Chenopodium quinoa]|uniref:protein-serine/threonine phosphatase n=1 Tax=Chenopodium quinoa TaxID=63459 RepID=A0A803KRS4_CHEQI|nr:probable protein phosphatase 2C 24 isoform X2 [Chenopodium quinoa]